MKKTCERIVRFGAGKSFDASGRATSFWAGRVAYRWDARKKVFRVHVKETLGTGTVTNSGSYAQEIISCGKLNKLLHEMWELQSHYKKVYEN